MADYIRTHPYCVASTVCPTVCVRLLRRVHPHNAMRQEGMGKDGVAASPSGAGRANYGQEDALYVAFCRHDQTDTGSLSKYVRL